MTIYWRDLEFILRTHILEAFSSLLDGAAIRASHGDAVRASWCSVLMERFFISSLGVM